MLNIDMRPHSASRRRAPDDRRPHWNDPTALGFSDAEVNKLLSEANPLEVREIETSEVHDEFWISIRGPLRHQAEALAKLQEVMAPYDGVTVELGTIAIG